VPTHALYGNAQGLKAWGASQHVRVSVIETLCSDSFLS
jgi:hypothetical protein